MMNYYNMLPDETLEERRLRWKRTDCRTAGLEDVTQSMERLAKETGNEHRLRGFLAAMLPIMFSNLTEEDQDHFLEQFKKMDGKLVMAKMSGEHDLDKI